MAWRAGKRRRPAGGPAPHAAWLLNVPTELCKASTLLSAGYRPALPALGPSPCLHLSEAATHLAHLADGPPRLRHHVSVGAAMGRVCWVAQRVLDLDELQAGDRGVRGKESLCSPTVGLKVGGLCKHWPIRQTWCHQHPFCTHNERNVETKEDGSQRVQDLQQSGRRGTDRQQAGWQSCMQ